MKLNRTQAANIISEYYRAVRTGKYSHVSARAAGRMMVEIYRLLTGEMPQASGIEIDFHADETPGVEFASPMERDPNEVFFVHPGVGGEPDVLIKGDQNVEGSEEHTDGPGTLPPRALGPHSR